MVGNVPLADFITAQAGGNYRVTHANDIVPKLPGYPLGFAHVSPEYWITSPTGAPVTANDVQVSSGVIDLDGNQGQLGGTVTDHLWYFNGIADCDL
jgi:triacylglycerol lipase